MPSETHRAGLDADMIIVNANVVTVDPAFSIARAAAITDAKIIRVGAEAEIRRYAGPATKVLDVGGRTVVPGLIDTRAHVKAAGPLKYTGYPFKSRESGYVAREDVCLMAHQR